jgi:hypothetical protein
MDSNWKEKYIRQLISISDVVDNEIKILSNNNQEEEVRLNVMFAALIALLRETHAPIKEPGFPDLLRLAANIIDLTIEQSKDFKRND